MEHEGKKPGVDRVVDYHAAYGDFLASPGDAPELHDITVEELRRAIRHAKGKASGLDGLAAGHLEGQPDVCLLHLLALWREVERQGRWPDGFGDWRIAFLPKAGASAFDRAVPPAKYRPLSIGPLAYRLWAGIRYAHCAEYLATLYHPNQAGAKSLHDAETLL
eukprot:8630858-Alexandrium_andersonii.AAC.1